MSVVNEWDFKGLLAKFTGKGIPKKQTTKLATHAFNDRQSKMQAMGAIHPSTVKGHDQTNHNVGVYLKSYKSQSVADRKVLPTSPMKKFVTTRETLDALINTLMEKYSRNVKSPNFAKSTYTDMTHNARAAWSHATHGSSPETPAKDTDPGSGKPTHFKHMGAETHAAKAAFHTKQAASSAETLRSFNQQSAEGSAADFSAKADRTVDSKVNPGISDKFRKKSLSLYHRAASFGTPLTDRSKEEPSAALGTKTGSSETPIKHVTNPAEKRKVMSLSRNKGTIVPHTKEAGAADDADLSKFKRPPAKDNYNADTNESVGGYVVSYPKDTPDGGDGGESVKSGLINPLTVASDVATQRDDNGLGGAQRGTNEDTMTGAVASIPTGMGSATINGIALGGPDLRKKRLRRRQLAALMGAATI